MSTSLRSHFDQEFMIIQQELLEMAGLIDQAIRNSMQAMVEVNLDLATKVIQRDEKINRLRFQTDERCLALLATQQPAARDLRSVVAALRIILELERMGDYTAGIAKTVLLMHEEPLLKTIKKLPKMAELSRQMLADCIQAFITRDAAWARQIAEQDSLMDEMYQSVFKKLIEIMADKPEMVTRATYLMWVGHNLERIADRVTNIAEQVIFMMTGDMQELNVA